MDPIVINPGSYALPQPEVFYVLIVTAVLTMILGILLVRIPVVSVERFFNPALVAFSGSALVAVGCVLIVFTGFKHDDIYEKTLNGVAAGSTTGFFYSDVTTGFALDNVSEALADAGLKGGVLKRDELKDRPLDEVVVYACREEKPQTLQVESLVIDGTAVAATVLTEIDGNGACLVTVAKEKSR